MQNEHHLDLVTNSRGQESVTKKISFEPCLEARVGSGKSGRSVASEVVEASSHGAGGAGWRPSQQGAGMESLQDGCPQGLPWALKPEVTDTGSHSRQRRVDRGGQCSHSPSPTL